VVVAASVTAGCSTTSTGQPGSTTTTAIRPTTTSSVSTPTTSGSSAPATDLPVTDAIRAQLVASAAGLNNIPVGEFTGLAPGLTYYALDRETNIYWAAARLVAAPTSDPSSPSRAQVSTQDDGSYYLFQQPQSGPWTAYADGNGGPATPCPVTVPPAVAAVWGWPVGSCRPAGI
jgi:hypothetical protein